MAQAGSIYEEMEKRYFDEQAGILAQNLRKDEACPVCGSLHHPKKAVLHENAPTQQQLKVKKTIMTKRRKYVLNSVQRQDLQKDGYRAHIKKCLHSMRH